jgi:hypothetical protein
MQRSISARRRPQVETLDGRQLLSTITPIISMSSATESNFQTVLISYDIQAGAQLSQFQVAIYRAPSNTLDMQHNPLIVKTSESGANATPGHHADVPVSVPGGMEPDPSNPFVFAVATEPDGINTSEKYFQKVVIGVVTHGFFVGITPPSWVTDMADSLKNDDHFNKTIAFPWSYSWDGSPNVATDAGVRMAKKVEDVLQNSKIVPQGAIVDLELIGHSRGAVVVNQAFTQLQADSTKITKLQGGYWREVLLDPHPASTQTDDLFSYHKNSLTGRAVYAVATALQAKMKDPPISVPSMVSEVQDYYEHTNVKVLGDARGIPISTENVITPWGVPASDLKLAAGSHTILNYVDLTANGLGHTEVHEWYREFVVPTLGSAQPFVTGPKDAPLRAESYVPILASKSLDGYTIVRFEDADPTSKPSDYSITIDWGDGNTSSGKAEPSSLGGFNVIGSHDYASSGPYRATVRINDVGGSKLKLTNRLAIL